MTVYTQTFAIDFEEIKALKFNASYVENHIENFITDAGK